MEVLTMEYLLATTGSIENGVGFSPYDGCHIAWLVFAAVCIAGCCLLYRTRGDRGRRRMRFAIAGLIIADELLKMAVLIIGDNYTKNYLPLHLCSVNLFLIAWHAFRPTKTLDNFLYMACIPGALAALLFPSWTKLPPTALMHIHSFTFHILLVCYPAMLLAGRDLRPDVKVMPKVLLLLACLAGVAAITNAILDTNYMYLAEAETGNPLYWFEKNMGSHYWGFAVILPLLVLIMYAPQLFRMLKNSLRKRHAAA